MRNIRRIGAMVAATVAATGMAMTVASAPASAGSHHDRHDGPRPTSLKLGSVDENDTEFVEVHFKTKHRVCNFKLKVADVRKVDVTHPGNRSYSSLSNDSRLDSNEIDFAGFWVRTGNVSRKQPVILPATISYDDCSSGARTEKKKAEFVLTIRNH